VNVSKIDQFCKLHGLSRTDLEATAGLSNGAIGKWERSIYGPSLSQHDKLVHLAISEILSLSENQLQEVIRRFYAVL
jgi:transcriptional regulator with XRE-family HTH domain